MAMTRRKFLMAAGAAGAASLVPLYLSQTAYARIEPEKFLNTLAIPPEDFGRVESGKRVFDLSLRMGTTQFYKDYDTATAGINSNYLGPVLRTSRGDKVKLNVHNQLEEPTTLHWHGVHLPAVMDGGPHQTIKVGETWRPEFEIKQPASTQWYHSHMYHRTGVQVYHGLAGLFYIDDEHLGDLKLPDTYGVNDIPLVIQDKDFNRDGSLNYATNMHEMMVGKIGNDILVNGVVRPQYQVKQQQVRLRILNGSNARNYNLQFSDQREFIQVASDGGFLETPVKLNQMLLSPGERAEIIVTFGKNEDVMLTHQPIPSQRAMRGMMAMMAGDDYPFGVMRFRSQDPDDNRQPITSQLAVLPAWRASQATQTRRFDLNMQMGMGMMMGGGRGGGVTINEQSFDLGRIDEVVKLNDIEIWEFINHSPLAHPMHIHDIQFLILDRNGKLPPPNERGLKDTVLVNPDETVRVITKFENYADEDNPYMYHCHILEHEDRGMMGQFVVKA